jgi:hypothetical protein
MITYPHSVQTMLRTKIQRLEQLLDELEQHTQEVRALRRPIAIERRPHDDRRHRRKPVRG